MFRITGLNISQETGQELSEQEYEIYQVVDTKIYTVLINYSFNYMY